MHEVETHTTDHTYAIVGGESGASRLEVLARIMWPETERLLTLAGLASGMRCLDIGCGTGAVTRRLTELTQVSAVGIDMDPTAIDVARSLASTHDTATNFFEGRVEALGVDDAFDLAYGRFILGHVQDPLAVLRAMTLAVVPGGLVVVEDVNMPVQHCYPSHWAFERYVELFVEAVAQMGADAALGPKLVSLFERAGLRSIRARIATPLLHERRVEKHIGSMTLRSIRDALVAHGIASAGEIEEVAQALEAFEARPDTLLTTAQVFQVWGRA